MIVQRVDRAGAELEAKFPGLDYSEENLVEIAYRHELPIGDGDIEGDVVARTMVLAGYFRQHVEALNLGYDAVCSLFWIPCESTSLH